MKKTTVRALRAGATGQREISEQAPRERRRIIKSVCDRLVGDLDISLQQVREVCLALRPVPAEEAGLSDPPERAKHAFDRGGALWYFYRPS